MTITNAILESTGCLGRLVKYLFFYFLFFYHYTYPIYFAMQIDIVLMRYDDLSFSLNEWCLDATDERGALFTLLHNTVHLQVNLQIPAGV